MYANNSFLLYRMEVVELIYYLSCFKGINSTILNNNYKNKQKE